MGAEYDFLLGALETMKKYRPIFYIEIHSEFCAIRCFEILRSEGAETFSGTPNLVLFIQDESFDFATQGQSFLVLQDYLNAFSVAVNPAPALQSNLLEVMALYSTFDVATQINYNYSVDQIQDNIDRILNYYQVNV